MLVVPDVAEPYSPSASLVLTNAGEARDLVRGVPYCTVFSSSQSAAPKTSRTIQLNLGSKGNAS